MDALDFYRGREMKKAVELSGRNPTSVSFLVAAFLAAGEEGWTLEQLVKMLYEINDYKQEPVDRARNTRELGF